MNQREAVEFTPQLATVFTVHRRLISQYLRNDHFLEYNEFSVLLSLKEAGHPQQVQSIAHTLSLSERMLWSLISNMEKRGLIKKDTHKDDKRAMSVSITDEGNHLVNTALAELDKKGQQTLWSGTPLSELAVLGGISTMKCLASLRGHSIPEHIGDVSSTNFTGTLLTYLRLLPKKWEMVIQERSKLTFGEYRLLCALERYGPMSPQHAADQLIVQKSSVTSYKVKLLEENLITQVKGSLDKRSLVLENNRKGHRLAGSLSRELNTATRMVYDVLSSTEVTAYNTLIHRMYHNLRIAQGKWDNINRVWSIKEGKESSLAI